MIPIIRATNADPNDTTKTIFYSNNRDIYFIRRKFLYVCVQMRVTKEVSHSWKDDAERIAVSFQCEKKLWYEFDKFMTDRYGNYKKSILIESLIRKYMKQKNRINTGLTENNEAFVF